MSQIKKNIQIYLDPKKFEWLKAREENAELSIEHQICEAIARYIIAEEAMQNLPYLTPDDPIWGLIGIGESQDGNLSWNHDQYLYGSVNQD